MNTPAESSPRARTPISIAALPADLPLGRRHLGVPDRGRGRRGRPDAVDLGHVLPGARRDRQRRHRRRRLRPLPPDAGRRGADPGPRRRHLPVLGGLAAGAAAAAGARSTRPGSAFYDRLVDELLGQGIDPWVTLYHWDLPQELEDAGGWPVRDTAYRFADYAMLVFDALERPGRHLDHAERAVVLGDARLRVRRARPGPARLRRRPSHAVHHLLLGHGLATQRMRAAAPRHARPRHHAEPGDGAPGHRLRRRTVDAARRADGLGPRIYLDPLRPRPLPGGRRRRPGAARVSSSRCTTATWRSSRRRSTCSGVNYYFSQKFTGVRRGRQHRRRRRAARSAATVPPDQPRTAMDWEIVPDGFTDLLVRLAPGLPRPADRHHRERRRLRRRARRRPASSPTTDRTAYFAAHIAAVAEARRPGRRHPRLLRLVADGQLRVGLRLRQALRHRPGRLRHPGPHPQGQRAVPQATRRPAPSGLVRTKGTRVPEGRWTPVGRRDLRKLMCTQRRFLSANTRLATSRASGAEGGDECGEHVVPIPEDRGAVTFAGADDEGGSRNPLGEPSAV